MTRRVFRCVKPYRASWDKVDRCGQSEHHKGACGPEVAVPTALEMPQKAPQRPQRAEHHQQTSRLAYQSVAPILGTLEDQVLHVIEQESHTTEEVEDILDAKHQTISACVSKLWHARGLIRPSGIRRPTSSGRLADVYERVTSGAYR